MKVDIIMRTKDRLIFLERGIKSVISQSYKDWELCIVNDGGDSGDIKNLINKFTNYSKQIKVINHKNSKGRWVAANAGIKATNGELVVIHDDDDTWHPDFLKKCVEKLQEPIGYGEIGGVVTKTQIICEKLKDTKIKLVKKKLWYYHHDNKPCISITDVAKTNQFPPICWVFYRKCFEKIGYFNEAFPVHGDWEFLLRFMANFDILFIEDVLAYYHIRIKGKGSSGNTVTNLTHKHILYHDLIVNKYIREDIKNNKVGLGNILAQAEFFKNLEKDLPVTFKFNKLLKRIKRFILRR